VFQEKGVVSRGCPKKGELWEGVLEKKSEVDWVDGNVDSSRCLGGFV